MKDTCRNILFRKITCHEILDIGLGEDTTAGCHRINMLGIHSQLAHFLVVYTHQYAHLVDKCTCSTGTVTVHAKLHSAIRLEENNLGVLSTDIDESLCLRMSLTGINRGCHNFLNKLSLQLFCRSHAHASRNADIYFCIAYQLVNLIEIMRHEFIDTSVVAFVF